MKLVEILGKMECKSLEIAMELNFKKLCRDLVGSNLVDSSKYRELIDALMFFENNHLDICFVVNTLSTNWVVLSKF